MSCIYYKPTLEPHGAECKITGDECIMLPPTSKGCPYLENDKEESENER